MAAKPTKVRVRRVQPEALPKFAGLRQCLATVDSALKTGTHGVSVAWSSWSCSSCGGEWDTRGVAQVPDSCPHCKRRTVRRTGVGSVTIGSVSVSVRGGH